MKNNRVENINYTKKFDKIITHHTLETGEPENHTIIFVINSFVDDKNHLPFASEEQKSVYQSIS